jgi:dihydrofolate synthase / folylpolyglutamate synthase
VFGAVRDKDVAGMIRALAPAVSRVIATQAATPRAAGADEVATIARQAAPGLRVTSRADPIAAAHDALGDRGVACGAGSIFLIGELRGRLPAARP